MAAMRLPSLLVPLPTSSDNHQFFNARIYAMSGAARLLEQKDSTPEKVAGILVELVEDDSARAKMNAALELWHAPKSAEQIAANILRLSFKAIDVPATEEDTTVLTRGQTGPPNFHAA
jgi:UDP-N-acetylglucosamine--N-acetylmuramyl-(pentapeptide) pyrophosphoryl-undecaprenol N-acetylglucosamine transferase